MSHPDPLLSVVLVMGDEGTRGGLIRALQSLRAQASFDRMEVILVDCSRPGTPPLPGSDHPNVRTHAMPRETTTLAQARAEGARQARAPIVGFLDEHSFAMAGWAEALIEAHKGPWAGVGGEIYNMSSAVGAADPIYLMGHGRWVPPAPRGVMDLLPSHDTCYKRDLLLGYGEDLPLLLMAEPVLMWKLREDGHQLFVEPDVKSLHGYTVTPLTLVAFYAWNRCFGYARARVFRWSRGTRILRIAATPILPWLRAWKLIRLFARHNPPRIWVFLFGLPFVLLAQYAAAVGETVGILFGKGNAEVLFTQSHLRGLRVFPEMPKSARSD